MRYLVISDIHGNLPALAAVLRDCPPETYDRVLVLGDLVGYGAEPGEVIDRVRSLAPHVVVRGNHDKAVCGVMDLLAFNSHARATPAVYNKTAHALPTGRTRASCGFSGDCRHGWVLELVEQRSFGSARRRECFGRRVYRAMAVEGSNSENLYDHLAQGCRHHHAVAGWFSV